MASTATTIRVRYAETDQMGIVYHSNYLIWMEVARLDYCRAIGFSYKEMEEADGILLAVAEAQCRYASPARFDDEVLIETSVVAKNRRMVTFGYEFSRGGVRLAGGWTKHIFLGRDLKPLRLPDKYAALFGLPEPSAPGPA